MYTAYYRKQGFYSAMTWHAHTIRLPLCMVSLGPRAKLLAQELIHYSNFGTASWTAISRLSLSSDRSRFVIALDESACKTPLCATCQKVSTGFLCVLHSSKPRVSLSFEIRASQSLQRARMHTFQWQVQRKVDQ